MALDGPVCSISCGVPVTNTDSLKFTVISKVSSAVKNPSFKLDETETTVGTDPFTDILRCAALFRIRTDYKLGGITDAYVR